MTAAELESDIEALFRKADELTERGSWDEAIELLSDANRQDPRSPIEAHLVTLRHRAFQKIEPIAQTEPWPPVTADLFADSVSLPEIDATDLTARHVASAILHHGSLLVRGLLDARRAETLCELIDGVFDNTAQARQPPVESAPPWYVPFKPDDGYSFGGIERGFANHGGGVLGAEAPRALFAHLDGLQQAGVQQLLTDYFGERPAISVKKTTLRRTEPDALAGWHQDGAFLGTDTHTLNIWLALSPCGVDAAGLDIFNCRFDELVETGGDEIFDWSVSDATASRQGTEKVVRPTFEAGDALLFDQMTLHRTGIDPSMSKTRYAIETWFFSPSTYPGDQIPILF